MTQKQTHEGEEPPPTVTRPKLITLQLKSVESLEYGELKVRLCTQMKGGINYLRSETLVCLIRLAFSRDDQRIGNLVLSALLDRCHKTLRNKVLETRYREVDKIREDILAEFSSLIAEDIAGVKPRALDYYECTFNKEFRNFRIDYLRRENKHVDNTMPIPVPTTVESNDTEDDVFEKFTKALQTPATQSGSLVLSKLIAAIDTLPSDQRKAVILVHVLGYKKGSSDPKKVTAATLCNCDERTIRNRLNRASVALVSFKEELNVTY